MAVSLHRQNINFVITALYLIVLNQEVFVMVLSGEKSITWIQGNILEFIL